MTTRRSLRIAGFVLYLVCLGLLTSCSLFSSDDSSPNINQEIGSADAQKAVDGARKLIVQQDDLDKAKGDAEQARVTANKLKEQADKMTAATVSDHKDPNNPTEAPNTYKAIQDQQRAEVEAQHKQQQFEELRIQNEKARHDLETATAELNAAKQRESSNAGRRVGADTDRSASNKTDSIMPSWPALLTAVGGLIILGLLFWLTWRAINDARTRTEELIREVEKNRSRGGATVLSGLEEIKTQLTDVRSELVRLSESTETDRQERLADKRQTVTYAPAVTPPHYELPVEVQEQDLLELPTSANALLMRLGGQKPIIKLDPVRGLLVSDPEGTGHLVLVQDRNLNGGLSYIVPRITRFQTKEEFYNHYEQYYDCNLPAAGEVWLHRLAVVDRVDGGWRLRDKGLLEVR